MTAGRTITTVNPLNKEERVKELAEMMSGKSQSDIALSHAETLLADAKRPDGMARLPEHFARARRHPSPRGEPLPPARGQHAPADARLFKTKFWDVKANYHLISR